MWRIIAFCWYARHRCFLRGFGGLQTLAGALAFECSRRIRLPLTFLMLFVPDLGMNVTRLYFCLLMALGQDYGGGCFLVCKRFDSDSGTLCFIIFTSPMYSVSSIIMNFWTSNLAIITELCLAILLLRLFYTLLRNVNTILRLRQLISVDWVNFLLSPIPHTNSQCVVLIFLIFSSFSKSIVLRASHCYLTAICDSQLVKFQAFFSPD